MRKNNLKSIPTSEVKSRVKMWRSGKNWVYGLLFFFGMTGVSIGQAHLVHADTKTLSANTEKGTIASQLSDQKVTLQSSIKASATDRTNLVTSDSEVSDSTAQPADTGENIAESQTDADASDTTQTADDTPTDSTSGSDQTAQTGETSESETTESSTNDPATLTTTETTLSTDATSTADSSKAATTVSNAPTQGHTTQTTNTTAQQSATTNTTVDSVASSTETVPSVNTPATTDGTTSQPKTTAGDTPSTVDTTNTPFPQVGYKSMLSAAQVQALNADNDVTGGTTESTDPAVVDSTTDPADTSSNAALPDGFTVTDPDYPQGAFANSQDSGLYSFFEASTANGQVVLSVDRDTATEVYVQTISGGKVSDPVKLESGQTYQTTNNYTVIDSGNTVDSIFVMGSDFTITYDIYSYIDGAKGTWGGWAALKPFKQTQTTRYVDQNGNEIAASVKMTGLSRQRYTTGTPESLAGYKKSDSGNTAGMMSPFMEDGQTFDEELYKKDSGASSKIIDRGTLTYTVKDVDKGTVTVAFKSKDGESMPTKDLTYPLIDKATNKYVEGAFTSVGTYTVPNIYIPQTTSITYKYEASMVKVPVKFVDQNGAEITPSNPDDASVTQPFNAKTPVVPPTDITGYTYNTSFTATATDNPATYTVTDVEDPGTITLHYIANPETVTVKHFDKNGNAIGNDTDVTGQFNDTVTVDKDTDEHWTIDGYQATGSVSYTFNDSKNQTVEVQYEQVITAPIHYVDNSGNAIDTSLLANAPQTLSGIKGENVTVSSPTIAGYTAFSDNPTTYTVAENDQQGVTLRYVPTTVNITWTNANTPTLTSNAGTPVAGQPISKDDPNGPKWPTSLTTTGLTTPANGLGSNGLVRTIQEIVDQYPKSTDTKPTTHSVLYASFKRTATIDFSDSANPRVTFGDWEAFAGAIDPDIQTTLGSDFLPAYDYLMAVNLVNFDPKTQVAKAFDIKGNSVALKDINVLGDTLYGLPARQVTADSLSTTTYNIFFYTLSDLQRTFTRTVNFVDENNQPIAGVDPVVQTVTATREPKIDFSNPNSPKATGYSDWTLSAAQFDQVAVKAISGYLVTGSAVAALAIDVDTTPVTTAATITYEEITGQYTVTPPTGSAKTTTWTTEPADPSKLADGTVPAVDGYTPVIDNGNGTTTPLSKNVDGDYIVPAPADPTTTTNIKYLADTSSVTVNFVDANDQTHKLATSQIFTGDIGATIDFKHDANQTALQKYVSGWLLTTDGTATLSTFGNVDQSIDLLYTQVTGQYTITPVTGDPTTNDFSVDPKHPDQYAKQNVPAVSGYTPVIDNGDDTTTALQVDPDDPTKYLLPIPNDPTQNIAIIYVAGHQKLTVHYQSVDKTKLADDVTLTGDSDSAVDYSKLIKSISGYVYNASESTLTSPYDNDDAADQEATLVYDESGDYTYTTPGDDQPTTTQYSTDPKDPTIVTGTVPYTPGYTPQIDGKDIPLVDSDDPSKGYTFTPTDPTKPATITYAPKSQHLTVYFQTADHTALQTPVKLAGLSDEDVDYSTINKQLTGYILQTDGTRATKKYDTDDSQDQKVILTYAALADGVHIITPTGEKTTTPYTNDSTDPKNPKTVDPLTVPNVPGYTPTSDNGTPKPKDPDDLSKGYTLVPTDPTKPTNVTYTADEKSVNVAFVDEAKQEISGHPAITISGVTDGAIDYSKINKLIAGYVLVSDETTGKQTFSATDDGTTLTIAYKQTKGGFIGKTPTGGDLTTPYVTNPKDPKVVNAIDVPSVPGYTPTSDNGTPKPIDPDDLSKGYTLIPTDPTQSTTITYTANDQTLTVHYQTVGKTKLADDVSLTGDSGSSVDYSKLIKSISGYVYNASESTLTSPYDTDDAANQEATLVYDASSDYTYTTPGDDQPTTTQYTTDPKNPATVTGNVPYTPGYTPRIDGKDMPLVDPNDPSKGYTFTPTDPTKPTMITYRADTQTLTVHYQAVDKTKLADDVILTGDSDSAVDYAKLIKSISGYVYNASESTLTTPYDNDDATDQEATLVYDASSDYTYTTPGDDQPTTTQYTTDPKDPTTVTGTVPYTPGYTPQIDGKDIPLVDPNAPSKGYTFTPTDPTKPTNITLDYSPRYLGHEIASGRSESNVWSVANTD